MVKTKTRILIDTHVFLWIFIEPKRFTESARQFIIDTDAYDFFLSDASSWEISIKFGIGKLKLPKPPERFVVERVRLAQYRHLPIALEHVLSVHLLPPLHGDPFDRLIISQAMAEDMTIMTADPVFSHYDVKTLDFQQIGK
jgi:PIN domain nuclease of toxin-antitoxin system